MKVWVVFDSCADEVLAVYSSRERAQAFYAQREEAAPDYAGPYIEIVECEIDHDPEVPG